jgi:hypothetical protein
VPSRIDELLRELTINDFMRHKPTKPQLQGMASDKKRHVVLSQNTLLGERGARGFAVFGLMLTMFGLYWYEHHQPSVSPLLRSKPYHYALAKNIPLVPPTKVAPKVVPKIAIRSAPGYTIQLMGSFNKATVESKLASTRLAQAQLFSEQYKQKPWYVLGLGDYKTREQATLALHKLPESLQGMGAWVRPVK